MRGAGLRQFGRTATADLALSPELPTGPAGQHTVRKRACGAL